MPDHSYSNRAEFMGLICKDWKGAVANKGSNRIYCRYSMYLISFWPHKHQVQG